MKSTLKCDGRTDTRMDKRMYNGGQNYMPSSTSWLEHKKYQRIMSKSYANLQTTWKRSAKFQKDWL